MTGGLAIAGLRLIYRQHGTGCLRGETNQETFQEVVTQYPAEQMCNRLSTLTLLLRSVRHTEQDVTGHRLADRHQMAMSVGRP